MPRPSFDRTAAGPVLAALAPLLAWSTASAEPPTEVPAPAATAAAATPADVNDTPTAAQPTEAPSAELPARLTGDVAPASEAYPDAAVSPVAEEHASLAPPSSVATGTQLTVARSERGAATPWLGTGLDVGVPDGATMSLVVRPIRSIRVHTGLSHNGISLGERVGVTWIPLRWWAAPTASLEYGHYADGNANPLVRTVMGDSTFSSAVLDRVGYDYANARLGLELGRRWFTFYIHAGVSRITGQVHNLTAEAMSQTSGSTSITFSKDPTVQLWTVSARIGFVVYLAK